MPAPSASSPSLVRAALRFARTRGIELPAGAGDVVAALGFALLDPARAADRRRWLHTVSYHTRANGAERPAMSQGRSNAAVRFLAKHRVAPGLVLSGRQAERLMNEWDRVAKRAFRAPADPVWMCEWWVDSRRRFRVALAFSADGSAAVGYVDCGGKCANAAPRSTTPDHMSQKSAAASLAEQPIGNADAASASLNGTAPLPQNGRESGSADLRHTPRGPDSEGKSQPGSVSPQAV